MDALPDIVRVLLIDQLLGGNLNDPWPVFVGSLPDQPDAAMCVYDTSGRLDGRIMATGEQIEHPGIMILVRAPVYLDAIKKARTIAERLDVIGGIAIPMESTVVYLIQNISRTGAILPLGIMEDDRRRYHFSINAVLTYRKE